MAIKTFIKVKRGILEPKHREALGIKIWLYLFMLDHAEWETGKIPEWRDWEAADEMSMLLRTVRDQRQGLETAGYIQCVQAWQKQTITIFNYQDPRSPDGPVLNPKGDGISLAISEDSLSHGDIQVSVYGDRKVSPLTTNELHGDTNGDTNGDPSGVTLPCNQEVNKSEIDLTTAFSFAMGELQRDLGPAQFGAYLQDLKLVGYTGDKKISTYIPNRLAADWIKARRIDSKLAALVGERLGFHSTLVVNSESQGMAEAGRIGGSA